MKRKCEFDWVDSETHKRVTKKATFIRWLECKHVEPSRYGIVDTEDGKRMAVIESKLRFMDEEEKHEEDEEA